jgi:syntaxin 6
MSEYSQLDSPKMSRVHPTTSAHASSHSTHDDDDRSFRSISSKFSRASRKSIRNGELGASLISSQDHDDESSSTDRDDSFSTNNLSSNNIGAVSPNASAVPSQISSPSLYETASMAQDDPFYIFRGDLVKKLLLVEGQLEKYLEVVRTTDTATNTHEIKETKKLLKRHLKSAESTLSDLETTIRVVERNRSKFPHISDEEVRNRRSFVTDSQARIQTSKDEMQSNQVKDKLLSDEKAKLARRKALSNNSNQINQTMRQANDNDLRLREEGESSRSETMLMMQQQDDTLDGLSTAVTRVSHMAGTIHEEIETQNKMLTELEDDLVDAEEQLGVVMGKLGKLLKTRNRCQIGLILILSLIVLVLFFLVLYT